MIKIHYNIFYFYTSDNYLLLFNIYKYKDVIYKWYIG